MRNNLNYKLIFCSFVGATESFALFLCTQFISFPFLFREFFKKSQKFWKYGMAKYGGSHPYFPTAGRLTAEPTELGCNSYKQIKIAEKPKRAPGIPEMQESQGLCALLSSRSRPKRQKKRQPFDCLFWWARRDSKMGHLIRHIESFLGVSELVPALSRPNADPAASKRCYKSCYLLAVCQTASL